MDLDTHKPEVAKALLTLERSLERLTAALAHRDTWVCVEERMTPGAAIERICAAYATITYGMDDAPNQSPVSLGVVGASSDVVALAERVNAAKAAFKAVCIPLQKMRTRVPVKGEGGPTKAIPVIRAVLRALQRSDVNLLAAYRRIPILTAPPKSVTYTRAQTRAVYRKSIEEIGDLLQNLDGPEATRDRERLSRLASSERHLALVRDHYDNIRANVVYERLDKRGRGRVQVAAELPLLYAQGRHPHPPEVTFPRPAEEGGDTTRRTRKSKLEASPCLRSLPVYRYARDR
ncbi:MAG: hypothetical protein AB7N70_03675 [Dehalococcoidia bacterium]